jgi:hypothetical protein
VIDLVNEDSKIQSDDATTTYASSVSSDSLGSVIVESTRA